MHIEATVDGTRANLATLINAPTATTSGGVALATQNARAFAAKVSGTECFLIFFFKDNSPSESFS